MILFHGSNRRFKKLRVASSLVSSKSTLLNEGIGIYVSTLPTVAQSYGKYLYTIEIPNCEVIDFTNRAVITNYLRAMFEYGLTEKLIWLIREIDVNSVVDGLFNGNVAFNELPSELELHFDGSESWYNLSDTTRERVLQRLRSFNKKNLKAYMYNSATIPGVGIIKDVTNAVITRVQEV